MSKNEINLREVRARIGYLVERAEHAGEITIITKHGRPAAAIVPINLVPQEETMTTYTLTVVEGIQPGSNGHDIGDPDSPVSYDQLNDNVTDWLTEQGFDVDNPDVWVLVTPADEDPQASNVIASRDVTV